MAIFFGQSKKQFLNSHNMLKYYFNFGLLLYFYYYIIYIYIIIILSTTKYLYIINTFYLNLFRYFITKCCRKIAFWRAENIIFEANALFILTLGLTNSYLQQLLVIANRRYPILFIFIIFPTPRLALYIIPWKSSCYEYFRVIFGIFYNA